MARAVGAVVTLLAAWLVVAAIAPARGADAEPTTLRATFASFPDYLDPQLSYTAEGWTAMYDTYIPLLTYRHAAGKAGSEVIPGLARALPRISDGGRKYVLFLRKGLHYSDGQVVRASDFEFAVKRMFRLFSGGFPFFYDIAGVGRYQQTGRGGISGIEADNATGKIVITLARPRGTFTQELALPFVALVPPNTPMRDQSGDPPPGIGPYAIVSSSIGEGWSYERNPEWEGGNATLLPELPSGHFDRIEVTVIRDLRAQVAALKNGEIDWIQNPPPTAMFAAIKRKYLGSQFRIEPTHSVYYFWMNSTKAPFDDVRVRRAVNYAIDPLALRRIYAGQLAPTQQVLPPDMPGYRKLELYPHDIAMARRLIAKAKPRDRQITVWGDTESPNEEAAVYYAGVLRKLGFEVRLKILNADSYFTKIGNLSTPDLDTGWSNWFEDYSHPNDFFQPLLAGESILRRYNSNFSQIDVPALNRKMVGLRERKRISEAGYAALDRAYMKLAPMAPYGTRLVSTFVSKAIDLDKVVWNSSFGADLASFQFK
jgi:peptide/nickel transport system substrate-binding protein